MPTGPRHRRPAGRARWILAATAVCLLLVAVAFGAGWLDPDHGSSRAGHDPLAAPGPLVGASALPGTPSLSTTPSRPSTPVGGSRSTLPASHAARPTPTPTAPAGSRTVTFVNAVTETIWVAGWQQTAKPALATTGWVLPAGHSLSITVPDHWNGRFWGRTGCSFDSGGHGHCQTGDCGGRFQCRGYGGIPATLAEYNMNSFDNLDFYDVSMVDGSNLPMYINITHGGTTDKISSTGCSPAGCTKPVNCPAALVVTAGGSTVGCISACARLGTDQYCCRGAWASRAKCNPADWPINYAAVFKRAEPYAYSYSDDDATSTFTCKADCDYRITFGITP